MPSSSSIPQREGIAVAEAKRLNIPTVAIVDTNADPELINFPIAGNDDAIRAIRIVLQKLVDAIVSTRTGRSRKDQEALAGGQENKQSAARQRQRRRRKRRSPESPPPINHKFYEHCHHDRRPTSQNPPGKNGSGPDGMQEGPR